jgi:hypothetical protein
MRTHPLSAQTPGPDGLDYAFLFHEGAVGQAVLRLDGKFCTCNALFADMLGCVSCRAAHCPPALRPSPT